MRPHRRPVLAGLLATALLGLIPLTAPPAQAAPTTYYVATSGSDSNAGTSLSAPFRTIDKCADTAVAGDQCLIRGGTYRETVTPANSGTSSAPITYAPYNGESVTVSGADPVTGWTRYSGNVYVADVTLPVSNETSDTTSNTVTPGAVSANQVFVNSTMMPEAQYPNPSGDLSRPATATAQSGTGELTVYDSGLPTHDLTGAVEHVVNNRGWTATANIVTSSTSGSFTVRRACWAGNCNDVGSKYYLTGGANGLALLDAATEWWYDGANHKLYLWAPDGGAPTGVEAKQRNYAFDLSGRSHTNITGLGIFSATVLTSSTSGNNTLDGLNARYVSHSLTLPTDPQDTTGCNIWCSNITNTGIILDGTGNTLRNSVVSGSAGSGVAILGGGTTVTNNLIRDVDYLGGYAPGVGFGFGGQGTVTHNTILNSGRFLIGLNPGGTYSSKNTISYNNLFNYGIQTRDLGAIYVCCHAVDGDGTSIDHNLIHDSETADRYSTGVYLDDGASGFVEHHNVFWDTGRYGTGLNATGSGSDGTSSNLLYNNTVAPGVGYSVNGYLTDATGTEIRNNVWAHGSVIFLKTPPNAVVDHNSANRVRPRFVNPAVRDYRLQAASPALDAGTAVSGITDGYSGSAPDQGAYESGGEDWTAGCGLSACRATTNPYLGVQAASYSAQQGTIPENASEGGRDVAFISNGDWNAYAGLDFAEAPTTFHARVASPRTTPGTIEVRLGSATGTLAGTCTVPSTGSWQTYTDISCDVSGVGTGTKNVYLVHKGSTSLSSLYNLLWFRFSTDPVTTVDPYTQVEAEQYDAQSGTELEWASGGSASDVSYVSNGDYTAYQDVSFGSSGASTLTVRTSSTNTTGGTVEARLDSPTGTLLGTCTAPDTGGWQVYSSQSCDVSGATGTHTLYLVFKGGSGNLMNFDWFRFTS